MLIKYVIFRTLFVPNIVLALIFALGWLNYVILLQFLPPQFASEMSLLIDESAFLEDSNGRRWEVTVSSVNGSLVFHQGWNKFAVSHDLEIGDFVVFFQLTESLFVVKIYDKTACERVSFSKRCYQRKRSRRNNISTENDGPDTSVSPCSDIEVYCMINRDLGEQGEEDRICDLDLSLFETCKYSGREGSSQACVTSGISPLPVAKSVGSGALHSVKNSSWHLLPMSAASKGFNYKISIYSWISLSFVRCFSKSVSFLIASLVL